MVACYLIIFRELFNDLELVLCILELRAVAAW